MRLGGQRESSNVDDIRGAGGGFRIGRGGGLGCGGLLIVMAIAWLTGTNPLALLQQVEQTQTAPSATTQPGQAPATDEASVFARKILASTEDVWGQIFQAAGSTYQPPRLTLYTDAVQSACGYTSSAVGPFYCPGDQRVYLDLTFFEELDQRFGAPGDFAQAYVIAHEVGHHVQNLLGIAERMTQAQQNARSQADANAISVEMELQADCFAGVWGNHARELLEPGDAEEGLRAAAAIGDDRLQRATRGEVQPDSFTHGTSEQRVAALRRGLESGDPNVCESMTR